jgi:uncharacterized protein YndB with AHSA1/START domain
VVVTNRHEIVIGAPVDKVFAWVSDLDKWREWRASAGQFARTTSGPVGVGTTWQASGRVMDEPMTVTVEVTAHEPNAQFALKVSGSLQAEQAFTFEPLPDGTKLAMALKLADRRLAEPAREQWDGDLLSLKDRLESDR